MVFAPLIFFSLLALYQYRRNGHTVDLAMVILGIYGVSSIFTVLMDNFDLWNNPYNPSIEATLFYFMLFSICIYPIAKYSSSKLPDTQPIPNERKLKIIAWVSLVWFVVMLSLSYNTIMMVLNGDMMELRNMIYRGDTLGSSRIPYPFSTIYTIANLCFGCPWIFVFLAFFSLFIQKLPYKYFIIFMVVSFSGPISGMMWVDRSRTAYWIISLIACFLFFSRYMSSIQKKWTLSLIGLMVIVGATYLSMVTESRFGGNTGGSGLSGSLSGLIEYLGQPYFNFCYFYDEFQPPYTTLAILFPSFYRFVLGSDMVGGTVLQSEFDSITNFSTGVFYTFWGHIMIFAGKIAVVVFSIVYSFVSSKCYSKQQTTYQSISDLYNYYALSSILVLGVFVHYYATYTLTSSAIFFYFLMRYWLRK